jgi:hypothetical protein
VPGGLGAEERRCRRHIATPRNARWRAETLPSANVTDRERVSESFAPWKCEAGICNHRRERGDQQSLSFIRAVPGKLKRPLEEVREVNKRQTARIQNRGKAREERPHRSDQSKRRRARLEEHLSLNCNLTFLEPVTSCAQPRHGARHKGIRDGCLRTGRTQIDTKVNQSA